MGWHKATMLALVFLKLFPRCLVTFVTFHATKRLIAIG